MTEKVQRKVQSHVRMLFDLLNERPILWAVAIGFTLRFATAVATWDYPNSEAQAVAVALANGKGFSDIWYAGQGPTAHLMPGGPLWTALTYALFGQGSVGEIARVIIAFGVTTGCFALAALCCALAGCRPAASKAAFVFLLVVPIHSFTEAVRWQDWEGGLATLSGLATLALLLASERGIRYPAERLLRCIMPAVTFMINPIIGLAAGVATAIFIYKHRKRVGFVQPMLAAAACATLALSPWVIRNHVVLGTPVISRSNLGLELAIANYPGAVSFADPAREFHTRFREIHPHENPKIQQKLEREGGEIAYNATLLRETVDWMKHHPSEVRTIWLRHLKESLFPPRYLFELEFEGFAVKWRSAIASLISILGLISMMISGIKRDRSTLYAAAFVSIPIVAGLPFQTVTRYIWPAYPLLCCLAFDVLGRLMAIRRLRKGPEQQGEGLPAGIPAL